ncbi:ubiquinol-cytochrome c reductase, iron-sulfur subunit [Ancylostoma ceylanicum]|uniref:Ubiquinol-cytochrome c reductase, iron-sulfur subunit n=1 Tax=Ancylostoma ceylanicum TaxID=53326 RepID=A0A0D6LZE9_9BILA|nr:ubiquinol-cytochrome c reductase, iron-sulfur subunit [Ancylostoma ceylanicum]
MHYAIGTMNHHIRLQITSSKDVVKTTGILQAPPPLYAQPGRLWSLNNVIKGINASSRRFAHTDVKFPDMSYYRRESTLDPKKSARDTEDQRRAFHHASMPRLRLEPENRPRIPGRITLKLETSLAAHQGYELRRKLADYSGVIFNAEGLAADQVALATIEVDTNEIPEGQTKTFEWRGKPVFVKHRTKNEIAREKAVNVSELRHPQSDDERVKKDEWSVVMGVCTHLGCVPIPNAGDYEGGYFCPCHGTHFDASGRIRRGPAPLNLEVPPHTFKDNIIVIG